MDFELFKSIIREASKYGRRSFSLHLFGEPLLYPQFSLSLEFIQRMRKDHTVLLTTNGTLINSFVDTIVKSNVSQVLWTWRKEAKFKPETKEKLRKWGKFRVRFIEEVTPPEAYEEWKDWKNVEGRKLHNYGGNIDVMGSKTESSSKRWPCYHLWLAPAIAWNGNFLMCCADPHQKEVHGNVQTSTIAECWQTLNEVRESHLKGEFKGICEKCDVWKSYPNMFFKNKKTNT